MSDPELIEALRKRIESAGPEIPPDQEGDALLFVGNWHDSIPRALTLDPVLEAVDVRVYLLLRTLLNSPGLNRFPSYDEIQRLLNLSRPTVARCLLILRAARWISLCNSLRGQDGRFGGNVYAVHDEVLPLADVVALDGRYLEFLESIEDHHHPRVALIARAILETVKQQFREPQGPSRYRSALSRLTQGNYAVGPKQILAINPQPEDDDPVKDLNPGSAVQNLNSASEAPVQKVNLDETPPVQVFNSASESSGNQQDSSPEKILNSAGKLFNSATTTCSSSCSKKQTTTSLNEEKTLPGEPGRETPSSSLVFPEPLGDDERRLAWNYLKPFQPEQRQALLDELAAQIEAKQHSSKPIRNALGYLHWMCERWQDGNRKISR
jgi:hypothetical protein